MSGGSNVLVIFDQIFCVLILLTFCQKNHSIDLMIISLTLIHNTGILVEGS